MAAESDDSPAQRLGRKLKEARLAAGYRSQAAIGEEIGLHRTTVAKIESGTRQIQAKVLKAWCGKCGVDYELYEASARLAWVTKAAPVPSWFEDFFKAQVLAHTIWAWHPIIIPGLLQTPDYARVLYEVVGTPKGQIEEHLAARIDLQQQTIRREPVPVNLVVVMDEAVIRRQVGTPEGMHAQLMHLVELGEENHVSIQVIPAARGANAGHVGPFMIAFLEETDVMFKDVAGEDITTDKRPAVRGGLAIFDRVRTVALSGPESLELIKKVAGEWTP